MKRHVILSALLALLTAVALAPQLSAGAWPQERGKGFASAALRLGWPQEIAQHIAQNQSLSPTSEYYTIFVEYGLTERITIGVDLGHSVSGGGKTVAFVQYPLRQRGSGPHISAALGFGQISGQSVLRPALHLGWGLRRGWLTVDTLAELKMDSQETDYKIDLTWGRNMRNKHKIILQVQTGAPAEENAFVRLAPSYVIPLGKRFHVETGATWGVYGDETMGMKMGLWTRF